MSRPGIRKTKDATLDWLMRAVGTYAAAERWKVELVDSVPYTGFVICCLSGRHEDIQRMCKKFVESMQEPLRLGEEMAREEERAG